MKTLFYTGKGGVGKSTMAAATAWQLSRENRVLIVSLDPAHNLGDIFCVTLKNGSRQLTDRLVLREVDLKKLSRDYLEREVTVLTDTYKYLQVLNLDRYFSILKYSPGIEEYALLTSIEETIRKEKDFDYIIFDTPPTGLTLRFLALPQVTITWIDRLMQIRRQILEKRYTIQKIRGPLKEGQKSPEIHLEFTEDEDGVIQRLKTMKNNYDTLKGILQGEDCGVVLVFNPDVLSLRESDKLIEGLNDLGLPLRLLINNKVSEENREMASRVEEEFKKMAGGIPLQRVALSETLYCGAEKTLYNIPEDLLTNLQWREKKNV
jgi:arsenite/tail-anchored protein-transporting ATPase